MSKIFTINEVKGELTIKSTLYFIHKNSIVIKDEKTVLGKVGIDKGDWL